jgi:hypothetical protein
MITKSRDTPFMLLFLPLGAFPAQLQPNVGFSSFLLVSHTPQISK